MTFPMDGCGVGLMTCASIFNGESLRHIQSKVLFPFYRKNACSGVALLLKKQNSLTLTHLAAMEMNASLNVVIYFGTQQDMGHLEE